MGGEGVDVTPHSARMFVGRERELQELIGALDDAAAGAGSLILITGAPGIGKSRLAGEIATAAAERNARALWSRCREEEGAAAYWPWMQIMRALTTDERLTVRPFKGSESERVFMFESVATTLASAATDKPLVLIFEDLHRADRSSLLLLEYIASDVARQRMLIIGTTRDQTAGTEGRDAARDEIARHGRRIPLRGLDLADVTAYIKNGFEIDVPPETADAIHAVTEGNPLHVDELVRLLIAENRIGQALSAGAGLPTGIKEIVRRRVDTLPQKAQDLLSAASAIGREFTLAVLERITEMDRASILDALEMGADRGLLTVSALPLTAHAFAHSVVRETLYEALTLSQKAALHGAIADALEHIHGPNAASHLNELAHHFSQAVSAGFETKAIEYCAKAGADALAHLAYDEAAMHYERALQIMELTEPDETARCRLLLGLGEVRWRAGVNAQARDAFGRAAQIARSIKRRDLLAEAALGYGLGLGGQGFQFRSDPGLIALLEEALDGLGNEDPSLRVRVQCRLAVEMYFTDQLARRRQLCEEALEEAERIGDPRLKMIALYSSQWALIGPDNLHQRRTAAEQIIAMAAAAGDTEMSYRGHHALMMAAAVLGDDATAESSHHECERLAEELQMPLYQWHIATAKAGRAIKAGRLDEAQQHAAAALQLSQQGAAEAGGIIFGAQIGVISWLEGHLADLLPQQQMISDAFPWVSVLRAGLVSSYSETGRDAEAAAAFERVAVADFADIPRDASWLHTMFFLALPCWLLRDRRRAAIMYEQVRSHADENVVIGAMALHLGSAAFICGLLAATLERWDEAIDYFERAEARAELTGNQPFRALALREHAAALLERREPGDKDLAKEILMRSVQTMHAMGLGGFLGRANRIASQQGWTLDGGPAEATLRFDGDQWQLSFGGSDATLADSKGLRHLQRLLQEPRRELHALDLSGEAAIGRTQEAEDVVLDPQAKAAYRARLDALNAEVHEAEEWNDAERAIRAREEIEAITQELARSMGLGGRDRKMASGAERARLNVTRAIRSAISKIAEQHPQAAAHLSESVRTGTFCCYEPAEETTWETA